MTPLAFVPPGVEAEVCSCGWESWMQRGKGSRPLIFVTRHWWLFQSLGLETNTREASTREREMAARWPTQRPATPGTSYPRGWLIQGLAPGSTQKGGEVGLLIPLPPESSSLLFGALPTWARANSTQPVGAQCSLCILFEGHGNWGGDSWLLTSRPVGCQSCIMACASLPSSSQGWGPAHSSCICT